MTFEPSLGLKRFEPERWWLTRWPYFTSTLLSLYPYILPDDGNRRSFPRFRNSENVEVSPVYLESDKRLERLEQSVAVERLERTRSP